METIQYLSNEGALKAGAPEIPVETLMRGYEIMMTTRLVDEKMVNLQRQGTISFALASYGEEACSVASAAALKPQDWLYPQYRESGVIFWRGFTIQQYINHMFCNAKDLMLGRQMPNHFGSRELNVVTVSSPIGTKIPHTAGCAYAMKLQKEDAVAVCYFGEGATSEGDFHAGLNFAAVRKAPAIFFCRNNGYAISTPASAQFASDGIAPKGPGYGIHSVRIDGNDFFAIYDAVANARRHCLDGHGPVLIEAMTYRLGAHSTSDDPTRYRSDAEVEKWKARCPISRLGAYLRSIGAWNDEKEKSMRERIDREIDEASECSKKEPIPEPASLFENVYFQLTPELKRQGESCRK